MIISPVLQLRNQSHKSQSERSQDVPVGSGRRSLESRLVRLTHEVTMWPPQDRAGAGSPPSQPEGRAEAAWAVAPSGDQPCHGKQQFSQEDQSAQAGPQGEAAQHGQGWAETAVLQPPQAEEAKRQDRAAFPLGQAAAASRGGGGPGCTAWAARRGRDERPGGLPRGGRTHAARSRRRRGSARGRARERDEEDLGPAAAAGRAAAGGGAVRCGRARSGGRSQGAAGLAAAVRASADRERGGPRGRPRRGAATQAAPLPSPTALSARPPAQ